MQELLFEQIKIKLNKTEASKQPPPFFATRNTPKNSVMFNILVFNCGSSSLTYKLFGLKSLTDVCRFLRLCPPPTAERSVELRDLGERQRSSCRNDNDPTVVFGAQRYIGIRNVPSGSSSRFL